MGDGTPVRETGTRVRTAVAFLFVIVAIALGVQVVPHAITEHAQNASWPTHARYHVWWFAGLLLAVLSVSAFTAWWPFRRGDRWAWFVLLLNTVFGFGLAAPAGLMFGGGPPPALPFVVTGLMLVGLAVTWPAIFRRSAGSDPKPQ